MIKRLFGLTVFSTILLGLNQTANANEIIKLTGDVKLKRKGETQFQTANFLDSLNYEDEFQVGANSWLVIRCRNTDKPKIEQPGKYKVSNYCPQGEATEILDNNKTFRPPTEDLSQTPYIISPRNSSVSPGQIRIKWNRVSGATNYKVQLNEWKIETTDTEIIYTGELLTSGFYSVRVEADNRESSGDVGFVVIDESQAQSIEEEASKIKQEELETEAEVFVLANFYYRNDLKMLAIEVLEDLVRSGSKNKNIYLLLANIYDEVGLKSEAYKLSQKALELKNN